MTRSASVSRVACIRWMTGIQHHSAEAVPKVMIGPANRSQESKGQREKANGKLRTGVPARWAAGAQTTGWPHPLRPSPLQLWSAGLLHPARSLPLSSNQQRPGLSLGAPDGRRPSQGQLSLFKIQRLQQLDLLPSIIADAEPGRACQHTIARS